MDYLGYVVWFSLSSDVVVELSELERLREFDPLIKLPKAPSKKNLFKRVCRDTGWKINGVKYEFINGRDTKRAISKFFVRKNKSDLIGIELGEVVLNLKTKKLSLIPSSNCTDDDYKNLNDAWGNVNAGMEQRHTVDHMAIRAILKDCLENKLAGVRVNTSTYFVEATKKEELDTLSAALPEVLEEFHILPVVPEPSQFEMLARAYNNKTVDLFEEFKDDLKELPAKPSAYKVKKLKKKIREIKALEIKTQSYDKTCVPCLANLAETSLEIKLS